MAFGGNTSESRNWLQSKNRNTKTCLLEDLEAEAELSRIYCLDPNEILDNLKHNVATMNDESSITKSTISTSTPNIFSLSTTSTTNGDFKSLPYGNQDTGKNKFINHFADKANSYLCLLNKDDL